MSQKLIFGRLWGENKQIVYKAKGESPKLKLVIKKRVFVNVNIFSYLSSVLCVEFINASRHSLRFF